MLKDVILVFIGGGLGSVLRYLVAVSLPQQGWPLKTMIVNVLGSLLIGILLGSVSKYLPNSILLMLTMGLCGGFTTFSTFSFEVLSMFQTGNIWGGVLYALLSVILCVAFVAIGFKIVL